MTPKTPGQIMFEHRFGLPQTPPPAKNLLDEPFPHLPKPAESDDTQPSRVIRMEDTQSHIPGEVQP